MPVVDWECCCFPYTTKYQNKIASDGKNKKKLSSKKYNGHCDKYHKIIIPIFQISFNCIVPTYWHCYSSSNKFSFSRCLISFTWVLFIHPIAISTAKEWIFSSLAQMRNRKKNVDWNLIGFDWLASTSFDEWLCMNSFIFCEYGLLWANLGSSWKHWSCGLCNDENRNWQ